MDNRLPILIEAAKKSLAAIADNAIDRRIRDTGNYSKEDIVWLYDRTINTGLNLDERLKEAHTLLQQALKILMDED